MVKSQKAAPAGPKRTSDRLARKPKPPPVEKKKAAPKRAPKTKKTKQAENGNKAEEPKAEATEAK